MALISIESLKVYFFLDQKVIKAIEDVSLTIDRAETVALVGESGCGKSVTALSIMGLIPQPPGKIISGNILFEGRDIIKMNQKELQDLRGKEIAMVFQEPMTSLNPVLSIEDQMKEVIKAHEALSEKEIYQRCIEMLDYVGIDSPEQRLKSYPHQLSGGQRQRIMIAMALLCSPKLLIADEPTTALDVTVQAQIMGVFKRIQQSKNMSILYITHDLRVVYAIADRVYVMYLGMVVESAKKDELFKDPMHPYTKGLLNSIPDPKRHNKRLNSIPGVVPDPSKRPSGCPFHTRCPYCKEICKITNPELIDIKGNGHRVRCHLI